MKQNLACKGLGISEALIFPHMSPVYQVHGIPVDIKPANVQGDWQSLGLYSMHIYIQLIWIWFWILFEFEFVFVLLYGPQMPCLSYIIRIHGFTVNGPISQSQNAPVLYLTMLHSEQKCAHFCSEWSIVGYGTGEFWDLLIRSNSFKFDRWPGNTAAKPPAKYEDNTSMVSILYEITCLPA